VAQELSDVSVVMITRGRPGDAVAAVRRLLDLPERPQVVVVDHNAEPLPERYPDDDRLLVLRPGHDLGAAGRNLGVESCRSPFVAFCDDDSWWQPGSLSLAASLFEDHPSVGLLAAHVTVEPDGRPDPFCTVLANSPLDPGVGPGTRVLGFMACAAVVRREAFLATGGFPAGIGVGAEEDRLALDLAATGWELRYVPNLRVHHQPGLGRDHSQRNRVLMRNALWASWQRLPLVLTLRESAALLARRRRTPGAWAGAAEAVAGAPRVLLSRSVVPPSVAADRARLLETSLQ